MIPPTASIHLAAAVDDLQFADEFLSLAMESAPADEEDTLAPELESIRATCRLFTEILREGADGRRLHTGQYLIRKQIRTAQENPDDRPGLGRAALALEFARSSLTDARNLLDDSPWGERCDAADHVLDLLHASLVCLTRPLASDLFFGWDSI